MHHTSSMNSTYTYTKIVTTTQFRIVHNYWQLIRVYWIKRLLCVSGSGVIVKYSNRFWRVSNQLLSHFHRIQTLLNTLFLGQYTHTIGYTHNMTPLRHVLNNFMYVVRIPIFTNNRNFITRKVLKRKLPYFFQNIIYTHQKNSSNKKICKSI